MDIQEQAQRRQEQEEQAIAEEEAEDVVLDLPAICEEPQISGAPGALRRSRQGPLRSSAVRASGRVRRSAAAGGPAGPGGVRESIPLFVLQGGAAAGLLSEDEDGTDEFLDEEFLAGAAGAELPLDSLEEEPEGQAQGQRPAEGWQLQAGAGGRLLGGAQRVQGGSAVVADALFGGGLETVKESALSSPALSEASG